MSSPLSDALIIAADTADFSPLFSPPPFFRDASRAPRWLMPALPPFISPRYAILFISP